MLNLERYNNRMKHLITKAHITLQVESDNIEKVRTEIAEYFGVETKEVHLNYEEIKEENKEE